MAHDPRYAYSLIKSEIKAAKTYRVEKIDLLVPEQETQLDHSQLTTFSPRLPDSDTFNCSDPEKVDSELIRMSVSRMHAASMLENTDSYKVSYIWARERRSHVVMADRNGAHMCDGHQVWAPMSPFLRHDVHWADAERPIGFHLSIVNRRYVRHRNNGQIAIIASHK